MAIRRTSIKQQIEKIRRVRTKRDDATGMLYNNRNELRKKMQRVTMFGLFVSDQGTFLLRPHLFESKKDARNAVEWESWFAEHYGAAPTESGRTPILINILSKMEERTGKQWRLYRIIGWMPDDNTRLIRSSPRKARNQTKRKGR